MFNKKVHFSICPDDIHVLDECIAKTASEEIFGKGFIFDPDMVYVYVRGMSAGEYWGSNNNGDYWEDEELRKNYKTFFDATTFLDHNNKDVNNGIGGVINVEYDTVMHCVYILLSVSKKIKPAIAQGIIRKTITDVSMGCKVEYIKCPICGTEARTQAQFCEHIKDGRKKRNVIYPDGRKMYEINRGCRFHDISIVTTRGADKTAKNFIVVDGANNMPKENMMQKIASLSDSIEAHMAQKEKLNPYDYVPQKHEEFRKEAFYNKLAELEKRIQGNILAVAFSDKAKESYNEDTLEDVSKILRMFYTRYWDDVTVGEIANQIEDIAKRRGFTINKAFRYFLNAAELCGIEITPLEFEKLSEKLTGISSGVDEFIEAIPKNDDVIEKTLDNYRVTSETPVRVHISTRKTPEMMPLMIGGGISDMIKSLLGNADFSDQCHSDDFTDEMDFVNILKPHLEERSFYQPFLRQRMVRILENEPMDSQHNQFLPILALNSKEEKLKNLILNMLNYAGYQNDRLSIVNNEKSRPTIRMIIEGNNFFDKQADDFKFPKVKGYTLKRALTIGAPLTFGYSGLQRSRMNNGEPVSGFDRYIAENPMNAFVVQAALGPMAWRKMRRGSKHIENAVNASNKNISAWRAENNPSVVNARSEINDVMNLFDDGVPPWKKEASILKIANISSTGDFIDILDPDLISKESAFHEMVKEPIFKNAVFLDTMNDNGYNSTKTDLLTKAAALIYFGRQDIAEDLLDKVAMNMSDLDVCLKIAVETTNMEVGNISSGGDDIKNLAKNTMIDTMFLPVKNVSAMSLMPGSLIDGLIFQRINKKLSQIAQPKTNI